MSKKSKSDISNNAIRIFLQNVGKFYDEARNYESFVPNKKQKQELLDYFKHNCCYCGKSISLKTLSQDHLIPTNKEHLGLHSWGNVVPCCVDCNNKKQQTSWKQFLREKSSSDSDFAIKEERILSFVSSKNYDPNLGLHVIADNLYEDVGEVAMTLINLRYKQAEEGINELLKRGQF